MVANNEVKEAQLAPGVPDYLADPSLQNYVFSTLRI